MVGLDGSVKLLDFGIAKATARSVETVSGIIKGKFAYMAPEQCRGRDVDRRSDVFSLGIILYEITTQHRCFRADSDFDTMHRIVTGDVVRPTRLVQGYPQALEAIVMKALAVDANQRYQSAGLLLEAIESYAVSSRMSLSTMALGRFMREMFGEAPEPWLQGGRANSGTMPPKEQTISNTNGSEVPRTPQRPAPPVSQQPPSPQSARTLLDLPRDHDREDEEREHDDGAAAWNAKSYPTMVPGSFASSQTLPPDNNAVNARSSPRIPLPQPESVNARSSPRIAVPESTPLPARSTPVPDIARPTPPKLDHNSSQQFPIGPGSGSHHSHPAIFKPGTNQSGQSYVDDSLSSVRVKPNRRPLWIGLGIVTIGIGIVLFISYGSGGTNVEPKPEDPQRTPVADPNPPKPDPKPEKAVVPPDAAIDNVHLDITSDPAGADVWQTGKHLGKTPLVIDRPRGTGDVSLVVQHPGYENVTLKVDLSGDYTRRVIMAKESAKPEVKPEPVKADPPKPKPPVMKPAVKPVIKPVVKPDKPVVKPDKPVAKPDCQVPGQAMPFDPRPVCKT
jgi:hypothetical protein